MSGPEAIGNGADDHEFDELISLLRDGPIEITDETPDPRVWSNISSELGLSLEIEEWRNSTPQPGPVSADAYALDGNCFGITEVGDQKAADPLTAADEATPGVVQPLVRRPKWGRPAALLTLAAAVILLLAVPITLAVRGGSDDEQVATAQLDLLEGQDGTPVVAELVSNDGDLLLVVDAPTEVGDGEFLELWLLDVDADGVQALESLGPLDDSGRYTVPDDVDLDRFAVVDISVEADDGDPTHSGDSVVRGEFG